MASTAHYPLHLCFMQIQYYFRSWRMRYCTVVTEYYRSLRNHSEKAFRENNTTSVSLHQGFPDYIVVSLHQGFSDYIVFSVCTRIFLGPYCLQLSYVSNKEILDFHFLKSTSQVSSTLQGSRGKLSLNRGNKSRNIPSA